MSNDGNYKSNSYNINSTANSVISKVVEDVISENFCLKKFSKNPHIRWGGSKNVNSSVLNQTQPKFVCIICRPSEDYKCKYSIKIGGGGVKKLKLHSQLA